MGEFINCSVGLGVPEGSTPDEVHGRVQTHSQNIQNKISALTDQSKSLREQANAAFEAINEFDGGQNVPTVGFDAALNEYSRVLAALPDLPDVYKLDGLDSVDNDAPPELKLADFQLSTLDAPDNQPVDFADSPTIPPSVAPPRNPALFDVEIPDAPDIALGGVGTLPTVQALADLSLDVPPPQVVDLPEVSFQDLPHVDDSGVDRMESLIQRTSEIEDYNEKMMPDVFTAVGALLSGSFLVDVDELELGTKLNVSKVSDKHRQRMTRLWGRRGFSQNAAAHEYSDRVDQRLHTEHNEAFAAALERWRIRALPQILELNVQAHAFAVDMLGQLYDLDFAQLEAQQEGLISLYQLAAIRANQALLGWRKKLAEYRLVVERVRANAQIYSVFVQQQQAVAANNRATAQNYAAQQRAKTVQVEAFRAHVEAAQNVVAAYNAVVQGVEAKATALEARFASYEGDVASWTASLQASRNEFDINRARNRSVVARNRAAVAQVGADASETEAIAHASTQSAAETSAIVAQLRADIASRQGQTVQQNFDNQAGVLKYASSVTDYRIAATEYDTGLLRDRVDFSAIEQINAAITSTSEAFDRGVIQAAERTQQYRTRLADAYVDLYNAAGSAEAAKVSGELSGYRASLGLRTAGSVDYRSGIRYSASYSNSASQDGSNTCETLFEPVTY